MSLEYLLILCGVKQEVVQSYIEAVRALGMRVGVIDSDILCLANMFQYNYGEIDGLSALVNIGASGSSVSLIYEGHIYTPGKLQLVENSILQNYPKS